MSVSVRPLRTGVTGVTGVTGGHHSVSTTPCCPLSGDSHTAPSMSYTWIWWAVINYQLLIMEVLFLSNQHKEKYVNFIDLKDNKEKHVNFVEFKYD